ncbi:hypothetical protein J3458_017292 [Metarhizium acridum]|uniref:uncharacterized protein n=1 Tax=Metarhizium acridum TaxID=92637 RepID=UPI001C6B968E|nr:hypothetical protein J3458_017292 [Metarhizium acridum]
MAGQCTKNNSEEDYRWSQVEYQAPQGPDLAGSVVQGQSDFACPAGPGTIASMHVPDCSESEVLNEAHVPSSQHRQTHPQVWEGTRPICWLLLKTPVTASTSILTVPLDEILMTVSARLGDKDGDVRCAAVEALFTHATPPLFWFRLRLHPREGAGLLEAILETNSTVITPEDLDRICREYDELVRRPIVKSSANEVRRILFDLHKR